MEINLYEIYIGKIMPIGFDSQHYQRAMRGYRRVYERK